METQLFEFIARYMPLLEEEKQAIAVVRHYQQAVGVLCIVCGGFHYYDSQSGHGKNHL